MDKSLLRCAIKTWPILRKYTSLTTCVSCRRIIHEHSSNAENTNANDRDYEEFVQISLYDHAKFDESEKPYGPSKFLSARSYEEVFELLQSRRYLLDIEDAIAATRAIYDVGKREDSKPEPPIGSREEFMQLCEILQNNSNSINVNQAIPLLVYLTHPNIGVSIKTLICQSLLQILSHDIDNISLDQIRFLQFILKKREKSVLSRALEISLPSVFEQQLEQQLPQASFNKLTLAFLYAVEKNLPESSINYIMEMINSRIGEMNASDAKYLFFELYNTNIRSVAFWNLLKQFFKRVANRANEIPFQDLMKIFSSMCWKTQKKSKEYYNANVIEAFVMRVITEDKGFNVAMKTLESLNKIPYSHIPILDYLADKCLENLNIIASCQCWDIFTLLEGFCISDYKPKFWRLMLHMILEHSFWETATYEWIVKAAYRLEVLGCRHHKPLHKVFKKIESDKKHDLLEIMMLHRNTKSLNPSYAGPFLDDDAFHSIVMQSEEPRLSFPLRGALETALGGPQYVLTNVSSRFKKIIDHVIVMKQGGHPVAINLPKDDENTAPKKYLEDMTFPSGSQVIIILDLPPYAFPYNSRTMTRNWSRTIKALEGLLYPIVPIHLQNMAERQRIPYLMQAVKLKCKEMEATNKV